MKSIFTKAGVTLALACALGLQTFAQTPAQQGGTATQPTPEGRHGRMGGRRMHGGLRHGMMLKQLNLTDAQREQLRALHERNGAGFQAQRTELRQIMQTRRGGGTLTPEQTARAEELRKQLRTNAEQMHNEMLNVLTPEQREQLKQAREQFKQQRKERREQRLNAQPNANPPINN